MRVLTEQCFVVYFNNIIRRWSQIGTDRTDRIDWIERVGSIRSHPCNLSLRFVRCSSSASGLYFIYYNGRMAKENVLSHAGSTQHNTRTRSSFLEGTRAARKWGKLSTNRCSRAALVPVLFLLFPTCQQHLLWRLEKYSKNIAFYCSLSACGRLCSGNVFK